MAKRYNDSRKYNDPWFRKLSSKYKCFWDYILSTCDHAGIWKVDFEMASFCIGDIIESDKAVLLFSDRVLINKNKNKWFVPGFIAFQYGELDSNNRVHNSVIQILTKEQGSFKGRLRVVNERIYMDKDKDKDKDKDIIKTTFGEFVSLSEKEHKTLVDAHGEKNTKLFIDRLDNAKGAKGYKYKSDYRAILSWVIEAVKKDGSYMQPKRNTL